MLIWGAGVPYTVTVYAVYSMMLIRVRGRYVSYRKLYLIYSNLEEDLKFTSLRRRSALRFRWCQALSLGIQRVPCAHCMYFAKL